MNFSHLIFFLSAQNHYIVKNICLSIKMLLQDIAVKWLHSFWGILVFGVHISVIYSLIIHLLDRLKFLTSLLLDITSSCKNYFALCGLTKIMQNIFCYKELQIKFCFMHNTKYISQINPLFCILLKTNYCRFQFILCSEDCL